MASTESEGNIQIVLPERKLGRRSKAATLIYDARVREFAQNLMKFAEIVGMKVSSRGWCYILEGGRQIDKGDFDAAQTLINYCRKEGYLPINFVAEDETRKFDYVEPLFVETQRASKYLSNILQQVGEIWKHKNDVAFWKRQDCYLQMMVEKVDVKSLFSPMCKKYHIPIANAKGWSDISERADMILRFAKAEKMGKDCILLYFGDHDPAGVEIAETIPKNLEDLMRATRWNPQNLQVDHFGLNYDFIEQNQLGLD